MLRVQGLGVADVGRELTVELELPSPAWAAFLLFIVPMAAALAVGMAAYLITGNAIVGFVSAGAGVVGAYTGVYLAGHASLPRATPLGDDSGRA
jgi:hypothetical protein